MSISPSLEPPSEPTMLARPRRRFPRVAAAVALGTAIAGGAVVHCAGQRHLQANIPGAEWRLPAPAVDRTGDTSSTPAPISAASTAVPGLPPLADPEDDPVPQPSADEAAPIVAADGGPEKVKKARRQKTGKKPAKRPRAVIPAEPPAPLNGEGAHFAIDEQGKLGIETREAKIALEPAEFERLRGFIERTKPVWQQDRG